MPRAVAYEDLMTETFSIVPAPLELGLAADERPWEGGSVAEAFRSTGSLPGADAVAAASVGARALVGAVFCL